jgi:hypothetical protein
MIKKRILGLALAACMTLAALPAAAVPADAAEASGKCGTAAGVTWSLSGGVLTISGSGDMLPDGSKGYGYEQYKDSHHLRGDRRRRDRHRRERLLPVSESRLRHGRVLGQNVGGLAFSACPKLAAVTFRGSGVQVNANAFSRCTASDRGARRAGRSWRWGRSPAAPA